MAMAPIILIANPGSASRKYALYEGNKSILRLHFEQLHDRIICTLEDQNGTRGQETAITNLDDAVTDLPAILQNYGHALEAIALRIVAPAAYFLQDHVLDEGTTFLLNDIQSRAPLHIAGILHELALLRQQWPKLPVFGISDSAFHVTKPDYTWNYGISLRDADALDIKRYGYHGLSVGATVRQLQQLHILPDKLVVCHLGSGNSVTAIEKGKSLDTTMGFSPLEGLVMATRSGNIDFTAARVIKEALHFSDEQLEQYLNGQGGLKGLSGISSDVRELLEHEQSGSYTAGLALRVYVHRIQQAIGQMTATLGGIDALVFTGTIGERSAIIRQRILARLHYLDLQLDYVANQAQTSHGPKPARISNYSQKPVYVVPVQEEQEMALRAAALLR